MGPLKLTTWGYWTELDEMAKNKVLPWELSSHLKALVNSHIHKTFAPRTTVEVIAQAKEYLSEGIELSYTAETLPYDVVVFIPDPGKNESHYQFLNLIPKCPEGKFQYLNEI